MWNIGYETDRCLMPGMSKFSSYRRYFGLDKAQMLSSRPFGKPPNRISNKVDRRFSATSTGLIVDKLIH
jgi:hypothetical protein